ncbi:phage scaffolding protein [Paenibacillus aurantiacus]|uniref:Phage scaffolding protein n=1 Tax=Paenibacillus aurantiacus TaxID=1936118 RepID=A0ABV5KRZ8_9BACL
MTVELTSNKINHPTMGGFLFPPFGIVSVKRDKQLTDLKKSTGDNEEPKKQIETLQADNKKSGDEYKAKLKDLAAIKLAVAGAVDTVTNY